MASKALLQNFDKLDTRFCNWGLLPSAKWSWVDSGKITKLYAGTLSRLQPQFSSYLGVTPFRASTRNIRHDVREKMPIADSSVDVYQSEDVFEHVPYEEIPAIFDEIFRVLKPGGLFRLSVPDYRCDILANRTMRNSSGEFVFDPGGGGRYVDGTVVDGGHLWFPVYETVRDAFDRSRFGNGGRVEFLHYNNADNTSVVKDIDYSQGYIQRTPDHDKRVASPRRAMSIVVDAVKL